MAAAQDAEFLTTAAVARRLGVSESTVRKFDRDGRLRAIRSSSNQRLFTRDLVEALAARRASEAEESR
jgi:excisionase family DNA binding protein